MISISAFIVALVALAALPASAQQAYTLFGTEVPKNPAVADPNGVTLGIKFWSSQPGSISAIRFYRGKRSAYSYTARLYTAAGSVLGSATVKAGAGTGWLTGTFAAPISINANTSYVAAYLTRDGDYAGDNYGLANGALSGPLVAPSGSSVGGNGVYHYGSTIVFPQSTYDETNYYVDVVFSPSTQTPILQLSVSPAQPNLPNTAPPGSTVATLTATWSNGAPFTGTYGFALPYSNDGGLFAISGSELILNGTPPSGTTTQNTTVEATQ